MLCLQGVLRGSVVTSVGGVREGGRVGIAWESFFFSRLAVKMLSHTGSSGSQISHFMDSYEMCLLVNHLSVFCKDGSVLEQRSATQNLRGVSFFKL